MKTRFVTCVVFLGLWGGTLPVAGQGFASIISSIERLEVHLAALEARLDMLETHLEEQDARRRSERDLSRASESEGTAAEVSEAVEALRVRLEQLEEELFQTRAALGEQQDLWAAKEIEDELRALSEQLDDFLLNPSLDEVLASTALNAPENGKGHEEDVAEGSEEEPENVEADVLLGGFTVSGFVDASYFANNRDVVPRTFGLDQVELDLERELAGLGSVRIDVEGANDGEHGYAFDIEQAFVTLAPDYFGPVSVTFGKFNAPIGFELLDPPDMYQYSHALVFSFGLPTNLTGALLSADLGGGFDVLVHVSNGWDENYDLNSSLTFGTRVGYSREGLLAGGISAMIDDEPAEGGEKLQVFDIDLQVTPVEALTLGVEYNVGRGSTGPVDRDWKGLLAMASVAVRPEFGLTVRYDYFKDSGASRLGSGVSEVRQALALAPWVDLGGGIAALLEFRTDWSDHDVFDVVDGLSTNERFTLALELIYGF